MASFAGFGGSGYAPPSCQNGSIETSVKSSKVFRPTSITTISSSVISLLYRGPNCAMLENIVVEPEEVGAAMVDGEETARGIGRTGEDPGRGPRGCCVVARPTRDGKLLIEDS